jgi:D-alanine transaminase
MTARRARPLDPRLVDEGAKVITIPDIRWGRPDIKSVSLLPNVLGKQRAKDAGAYEAWQVDRDGKVTEGTSSNAWIITAGGEVVTRQADSSILNGITRLSLIALLKGEGLKLVERPFTVAEAKAAREAFLTSTTNFVLPVVRIDDTPIGNGHPGSVVQRLREAYAAHTAAQARR